MTNIDTNNAAGPATGIIATNVAVSAAGAAAATGFVAQAVSIATDQWTFFGKQTYDVIGNLDHAGHTEGEDGFFQRVGQYWLDGTGTRGIDGRDHGSAWSAAFISFVMKKAGAGDRFRYSTLHSVYIFQGIRDFLAKNQNAGYWTQRLNEAKPAVGDLVCWGRQPGVDYDHQMHGVYHGHSDLVVEVDANQIFIIGGNVGNSVTRRPLNLDANGFLVPVIENKENLFGIMKCRIA